MVRFLIRILIFLLSAAVGLLVTSLVVADFHLSVSGYVTAVVVFAIVQSILAPFIFKVAHRYAPAFLGGIGLVTTFVALLVASLFPGGLSISGIAGWVLSTLVMWIVTALCTWLLPMLLLKEGVQRAKGSASGGR